MSNSELVPGDAKGDWTIALVICLARQFRSTGVRVRRPRD